MQDKEKRFSKRVNPISQLEENANFVVDTLFRGDLAEIPEKTRYKIIS